MKKAKIPARLGRRSGGWASGLLMGTLLLNSVLGEEPKEEPTKIEEIVVTATRSEKKVTEVPANITVITEEDIKKSGAQTIPDALRTEAGVLVRDWTGVGKTVNVDIRGFGETGVTNVLVLVDGRRVTQIDLSGTDWSQIPLERVSRIEVIRGAGSVLYGDNAAGGVINIITKKGKAKPEYTIKNTAGSYRRMLSYVEASGGEEKFSYTLSGKYSQTDGYRDNSAFYTRDGNARFTIDAAEYLKLDLSLGGHNDDYRLPGYLTPTAISQLGRRATKYPNDKASTEDLYHKLQITNPLDRFGTFITDITLRNRRAHSLMSGWETKKRIDSVHISPRHIMESEVADRPLKLTSGVDILMDKCQWETADVRDKKTSLGIYTLGEFSLSEPFNCLLGYRYERVKYDFVESGTNKDEQIDRKNIAQVGLTYLYQDKSSAYFNFAQSFRCPAVDEYFVYVWPTGYELNTELNPQRGNQYEIGIKHTFSSQLFGSISIFRMDIRDEIFYNKPAGINDNYDKTRHQGIEMYLSYQPIETLKTALNYSYTDAKFRGGAYKDNEIPGVPHNKASVTLSKEVTKDLDFILQAHHMDKRYMISDLKNVADEMDAYTTVDTKLMYRWKKLTAFIGVNNLFNQKYEEYGVTNAAATVKALYPSPERNYMLGVSVKF